MDYLSSPLPPFSPKSRVLTKGGKEKWDFEKRKE